MLANICCADILADMSSLVVPQIEGLVTPELPLAWRPDVRHAVAQGYFSAAIKKGSSGLSDAQRDEVSGYYEAIRSRYLMPYPVAGWAFSAVDSLSDAAEPVGLFYAEPNGTQEEDALFRRFEDEVFGLPPANTTSGARLYAPSAGGPENADYPADVVGAAFGRDADGLRDVFDTILATSRGGEIIGARVGSWLFKIDSRERSGRYNLGDVRKLTKLGGILVDNTLRTFSSGLDIGARTTSKGI